MWGSLVGEGGIYNGINLSLYHYGCNNPIRYTDPTGVFDWDTNTIESGDTLSQIANDCNTRYGTNYTADDLQGLNSGTISDKDKIYAGNHLNLGKAEVVQKRAADYVNRAIIKYSNDQVTPILQNEGLSRSTNIAIGVCEMIGGFGIWAGTIFGAAYFTIGTEGFGVYNAGIAVSEGLALGAFFMGNGLARIAGIYNTSILDDILNATVPIEKDMGENMIDMSKSRKHE